mgnify:CR=1 FL=1|jgi:hypothetical protein
MDMSNGYDEDIEECKAQMAKIQCDDDYMSLKEELEFLTEWKEDYEERQFRYECSIIEW